MTPKIKYNGLKETEKRVHGTGKSSLPAKLTRPTLPSVYLRTRLIGMLGEAFAAPAVWIEAQPGAGKTTLAASWLDAHQRMSLWYQVDAGDADLPTFFHYLGLAAKHIAPRYKHPLPHLTPEFLPSIEVFARRFFEELFRRMPKESVLVFDNVQDAGVDIPLHDILRIAIESTPAHVRLLFISRVALPPPLARLRVNGQLALLNPLNIRLTLEEAQGIAEVRGHSSQESVSAIFERTHGWVAGLVLMLNGAGAWKSTYTSSVTNTSDAQTLFNYFASEVLRGLDEARQKLLVKSALLPKMRVADVVSFTGDSKAGKMLSELQQSNYFTYRLSPREPIYEYHPLFREFLLEQLRERVDEVELARLKSEAGRLLAEAGQIEEAAELWRKAKNWPAMISLITKHAQQLLTEGRARIVESWLSALPNDRIDFDPRLQYWKGACRLAFDPHGARGYFEAAFNLFESDGDLVGQCESWASIIATFTFDGGDFKPLDRWIAVMDAIVASHPEFPTPEIEVRVAAGMLTALCYRQPQRIDITIWAERVEQAVQTSQKNQFQIMLGNNLIGYYACIGDLSKATVVIDVLRPSSWIEKYDPLARQIWHVMEAMYSWFVADWETCRQTIDEGLKNSEKSGVHLLDFTLLAQGVYGGLSLGDPVFANECMGKMSAINSPRLHDRGLYHYQISSVAWYHGEFNKSLEHSRRAITITGEIGWQLPNALSLTEYAVTLFDAGRHDEADATLSQALVASNGMSAPEFFACMNGAQFALERGMEEKCRMFLERGLALGERYGFLNMPRWNDIRMSRLLAKALEYEIQPTYVQNLITLRKLTPPVDPDLPLDTWPWPLKIRTLGRFVIERDGTPLNFVRKIQRQPLALLKLLIAHSGRGIAEARLIDALWPESEGDAARANLRSSVHRLRKLIGNDALRVEDGHVGLDTSLCWVDAWALDRLLENSAASERSLALYKGPFLENDTLSEVLIMRDRLRVRMVRRVLDAGERLRQSGAWHKALDLYERGIEIDPSSEALYRGLMHCHYALGERSEAQRVYERCRAALKTRFDLEPSPETQTLMRQA